MLTPARAAAGGVTLRLATVDDVPGLAALDAACFGPRQWPVEAWQEVVVHPAWFTLVAAADTGELTGAAVLLVHRPVSSLASLAVAGEWRGRGIGASLVAACLQRSRQAGAQFVVLEVDRDNHAAVQLYRRFGFRPRRAFLEDGIPRWEMTLACRAEG